MRRDELRALGVRVVDQARELRARFADTDALRDVSIAPVDTRPEEWDAGTAVFVAALRDLREEMVLVRDGRAETLAAMDDATVYVESLLPIISS